LNKFLLLRVITLPIVSSGYSELYFRSGAERRA